MEKIIIEVFLHQFKKQYVREDTQGLRSFILTFTIKDITSIQSSCVHPRQLESWGGITIAEYRHMTTNEKGARINRAPFSQFCFLSTHRVND